MVNATELRQAMAGNHRLLTAYGREVGKEANQYDAD